MLKENHATTEQPNCQGNDIPKSLVFALFCRLLSACSNNWRKQVDHPLESERTSPGPARRKSNPVTILVATASLSNGLPNSIADIPQLNFNRTGPAARQQSNDANLRI
jgi:hypothetical protein